MRAPDWSWDLVANPPRELEIRAPRADTVCPAHQRRYLSWMISGTLTGGYPGLVSNPEYLDPSVVAGCHDCLARQVMES